MQGRQENVTQQGKRGPFLQATAPVSLLNTSHVQTQTCNTTLRTATTALNRVFIN